MSLFKVIKSLSGKQIYSIADTLDVDYTALNTLTDISKKIRIKLSDFYRSCKGEEAGGSFRIVALWRDQTYQIIKKKKVPVELREKKQAILDELSRLISKESLDDDNRIEDLVRDILFLLWKSSKPQEQERFVRAIREELEIHSINLTSEEIKNILAGLLLGSVGSAIPFAIPIISRVMLQRLTQGLFAWVFVSLLGQRAIQMAALSTFAGPVGWAISGGIFGVGVISSGIKYTQQRKEAEFIQAIFLIYAYRYQNRFI
ncbi:hypothetical protein [Halomicronema sp. CCY15110]|uniref:hypothetical protein n=1 Tax=Halomicronema sp. CCY15110 TaxID=2767773 RepID=UPI00194DF90D|nr:hypothetical protein [Halomicronema sp. CCY15110]